MYVCVGFNVNGESCVRTCTEFFLHLGSSSQSIVVKPYYRAKLFIYFSNQNWIRTLSCMEMYFLHKKAKLLAVKSWLLLASSPKVLETFFQDVQQLFTTFLPLSFWLPCVDNVKWKKVLETPHYGFQPSSKQQHYSTPLFTPPKKLGALLLGDIFLSYFSKIVCPASSLKTSIRPLEWFSCKVCKSGIFERVGGLEEEVVFGQCHRTIFSKDKSRKYCAILSTFPLNYLDI